MLKRLGGMQSNILCNGLWNTAKGTAFIPSRILHFRANGSGQAPVVARARVSKSEPRFQILGLGMYLNCKTGIDAAFCPAVGKCSPKTASVKPQNGLIRLSASRAARPITPEPGAVTVQRAGSVLETLHPITPH